MNPAGPELTRKRVISLLVSAAVIVALFTVKTCGGKKTDMEIAPEPVPGLVISQYDSIFKAHSDSLFDWRLLAAIAYTESRFDTSLVSVRGAFGLMQVMPATYSNMVSRMGVDSDSVSTSLNVYAAVQHLRDMNEQFHFINPSERLNFILGAYNCGAGRVFDAMRIARKNGINRYVWSNIEEVMATMSDEAVYSDSTVCRFGRFNSGETVRYVRNVRKKYQEYCALDTLCDKSDSVIIPGA